MSLRAKLLLVVGLAASGWAANVVAQGAAATVPIGPAPVMSVYKWASAARLPVYAADRLPVGGAKPPPVGHIMQGTKLAPCIVKRGGRPIPGPRARPFLGFEVLYDAVDTTGMSAAALARYEQGESARLAALKARVDATQTGTVESHDCPPGYAGPVIDSRMLVKIDRAPPAFREPMPARVDTRTRTVERIAASQPGAGAARELAGAFHDSGFCAAINQHVHGRRARMLDQWDGFVSLVESTRPQLGAAARLAAHADVVARTSTFEGDLAHGCSAHGLCEIDLITLSVKNRGDHPGCRKGHRQFGCRYLGDYSGAAAKVTQYNIWDHLFTMKDSITSCYLRSDLAPEASEGRLWLDRYGQPSEAAGRKYRKEQARFSAALDRALLILGARRDQLTDLFEADDPKDILELRHYYHPAAMGKCFPQQPRQEYMSSVYMKRGGDYFLLFGERVLVGANRSDPQMGSSYEFTLGVLGADDDGLERVLPVREMPGLLLPSSRISLGTPKRCTPFGVEASCRFEQISRYRRTPPWLSAGRAARVTCRNVPDGDKACAAPLTGEQTMTLGGRCSADFMPMSRVP